MNPHRWWTFDVAPRHLCVMFILAVEILCQNLAKYDLYNTALMGVIGRLKPLGAGSLGAVGIRRAFTYMQSRDRYVYACVIVITCQGYRDCIGVIFISQPKEMPTLRSLDCKLESSCREWLQQIE